jgi:hypothetical protein
VGCRSTSNIPTIPNIGQQVLLPFAVLLQVIPIFVNPHKFAQHKQAPPLRALTPAEREVLLLLGSDISATEGQLLIQENDRVRHMRLEGLGGSFIKHVSTRLAFSKVQAVPTLAGLVV